MWLLRATPPEFKNYRYICMSNCSAKNAPPERNPEPRLTQMGAIFKKFNMKKKFKLKFNVMHNFRSIHPFKFPQSRETMHL
jgi:hypothetical protein